MSFLNSHEVGCKPFEPCTNCLAAAFLKGKLADSDFDRLVAILRKSAQTAKAEQDSPPNDLTMFEGYDLLPKQVRSSLHDAGIRTLSDLLGQSDHNLLNISGIARFRLRQIKEFLASCVDRMGVVQE